MGKFADEINKTAWWILQPKIKKLERIIFELKRGYTATGFEGWPCPGCKYDNGKLIERCQLHQRIYELKAQLELEAQLSQL